MIHLIILYVISIVYNSYIIYKYKKIPVSLSETAYLLGGPDMGNKKYIFTLYCVFAIACIIPTLFTLPENLIFLGFLICAGLLFAGVSPMFKDGMDKKVHYISAILSFIAFVVLMCIVLPWYWSLLYFILLGFLTLLKRECYVYFAEMLILLYMCLI